jgi:hypothetical protein
MHGLHRDEASADEADILEVDQAWLVEIEPEPITVRNPHKRRSRVLLGALVAGVALAGSIVVLGAFGRRRFRRPPGRLSASIASAAAALLTAAVGARRRLAGHF